MNIYVYKCLCAAFVRGKARTAKIVTEEYRADTGNQFAVLKTFNGYCWITLQALEEYFAGE